MTNSANMLWLNHKISFTLTSILQWKINLLSEKNKRALYKNKIALYCINCNVLFNYRSNITIYIINCVKKLHFRPLQEICHGLGRYLAVWWPHHPQYRITVSDCPLPHFCTMLTKNYSSINSWVPRYISYLFWEV